MTADNAQRPNDPRVTAANRVDVDPGVRRRAVRNIAGTYARDTRDLAELLAALGLHPADGR
jgi:hypothetical protein